MDVTETVLPGVGLRYEFTLSDGRRICVVASRNETFTISAFDGPDPDVGQPVLALEEDEAAALAEILGAPRIAVKFADLSKEVPGLLSEQIPLPTESPFVGGKLGDTKARTRTGSSIVAIVRDDSIRASPGPEADLQAGDVLVVIGTVAGIQALRELLLPS